MPRFGTLPMAPLEDAPELASFNTPELDLGAVDVLHLSYEIAGSEAPALLPPALNPSIPPHLTWTFFWSDDGPFGPFTLAQTRIGSRAGVKPRGLLLSAVTDNPELAEALTRQWAFTVRTGKVKVERAYHRCTGSVNVDGHDILQVDLLDPALLPGGDIRFAPNLNPARTPLGLCLVQVDISLVVDRADVGRPLVRAFDGETWGDARVCPTTPIVGVMASTRMILPRLRYVLDPAVPASVGVRELPPLAG